MQLFLRLKQVCPVGRNACDCILHIVGQNELCIDGVNGTVPVDIGSILLLFIQHDEQLIRR